MIETRPSSTDIRNEIRLTTVRRLLADVRREDTSSLESRIDELVDDLGQTLVMEKLESNL